MITLPSNGMAATSIHSWSSGGSLPLLVTLSCLNDSWSLNYRERLGRCLMHHSAQGGPFQASPWHLALSPSSLQNLLLHEASPSIVTNLNLKLQLHFYPNKLTFLDLTLQSALQLKYGLSSPRGLKADFPPFLLKTHSGFFDLYHMSLKKNK